VWFYIADCFQAMFLSGAVNACACWGTDSSGAILSPPARAAAPEGSAGNLGASSPRLGTADESQIKAWMKDTVFDPNDPRNVRIISSSKRLTLLSYSHEVDYFRLHDPSFGSDQFSLDEDPSSAESYDDAGVR
jgi:hypothetical protein